MGTPSPGPAILETPAPVPAGPAPSTPAGPTCTACGSEAVVHWRRRPTDDELAELIASEQARRADILLLADPQLSPPVFQPLPDGQNTLRTVYACAGHAITMDGAALVHASSCTAPDETDLPGCNCTPEAAPTPGPDADDEAAQNRLPASWLPGAV